MKKYPDELRIALIDYYLEHPDMPYHELAKVFNVPTGTAVYWIDKDESVIKSERRRSYSAEERESFIEHVLNRPGESLNKISKDLGISYTTLRAWLVKDPRYIAMNPHTDEEKKQVVEFWLSHQELTAGEVGIRLGVRPADVKKWVCGAPECSSCDLSRLDYSEDQIAAALDWYYFTPGASYTDVRNHFGYPTRNVFVAWCRRDPRYGSKDAGGYTKEHRRAICEYYMLNEDVTYQDAIDKFGWQLSASKLSEWCVEEFGKEPRKLKKYSPEIYAQGVEDYFSDTSLSIHEAARRNGLTHQTLARRLEEDPRWEADPRRKKQDRNRRDQHKASVLDYYFSNPHLSREQVCDHFGGFPALSTLGRWVRDDPRRADPSIYGLTEEEKQRIVDYHFSYPNLHVDDIEKIIGIPIPRRGYRDWVQAETKSRGLDKRGGKMSVRPFFEKAEAVIFLLTEGLSPEEAATRLRTTKSRLDKWYGIYKKEGLIGLVTNRDLPKQKTAKAVEQALPDPTKFTQKDVQRLIQQNQELMARNAELEFENDVCHAIFDVLKKDPSLSEGELLTVREKTLIINALRPKYKLRVLLERFEMPKSTYEYNRNAILRPDKYELIRAFIRDAYEKSGHAYGYRRITAVLRLPVLEKDKKGISGYGVVVDEKVVRRLMKEEGIVTLPAMRLLRYNSYRGTVGKVAPNLLRRDFHSDAPYKKLLTDVTEFHLNNYKVYLSPVVDCFSGEVISWTISQSPNLELVTTMLRKAIDRAGRGFDVIIHSDQGWAYQHAVYRQILRDAGWQQSMSRKGCCSDNSACEGFFGRLKNEFFYNHDFTGYEPEEFMTKLDEWIIWHNEKRIKEGLGYTSPALFRERWELEHAELASAA